MGLLPGKILGDVSISSAHRWCLCCGQINCSYPFNTMPLCHVEMAPRPHLACTVSRCTRSDQSTSS